MDNRPDIFDSKARLRDLSSLDIESLPPEMAELYTTLREVYVHNFEAEQYAAKVAHQIRIVAKLVQAERAERQRQQQQRAASAQSRRHVDEHEFGGQRNHLHHRPPGWRPSAQKPM